MQEEKLNQSMIHYLVRKQIDLVVKDNCPVFISESSPAPFNPFKYTDQENEFSQRTMPQEFIDKVRSFFKGKFQDILPEGISFCLAGGSIPTYFLFHNAFFINDFDLFPASKKDYELMRTHLDTYAKHQGETVYENENAVHYTLKKTHIDLIKRFGSTNDIIQAFDFNVCKFALTVSDQDNWVLSTLCSFTDLYAMQIRILSKSLDSMTEESSLTYLRRVYKYIAKGYKIGTGDFASIFTKIKNISIPTDSTEFAAKFDVELKRITDNYPTDSFVGKDEVKPIEKPVVVEVAKKKATVYSGFSY